MNKPMGAVAALLLATLPGSAGAASPALTIAAESRSMIWNGVAVAHGQVFVSGPHWSGSQGPAMARLEGQGRLLHYPDATWNSWHEREDPGHAKGSLCAVDTGSPQFGGNPLPGGVGTDRPAHREGRADHLVRSGCRSSRQLCR
jgi:hypothetical protein